MSSFRQYGGLNRASANNIVRSRYANSDNQTISNVLGLPNSTIVCESNLDLSGNDIYNVSNVILNNGDVITGGSYSGSLVVGGNLEVKQNTNLDGSVDIGGDLTVDGNLEVKQNTNLDGDVEVGGNLNIIGGNANVAGTLVVGGSSSFLQPVNMQSTLDVYDFARFYDNVAIDYGIYVGATTQMNGDVSMNSTLDVAGQSIFDSDVSMNSTLHVAGQSVFNSDVSMNSTLEVGGSSTFYNQVICYSDVSMNSTLEVAGQSVFNSDVSMNSTLEVGGSSTFYNQVICYSDVSMNSTLAVAGQSIFDSDVSMNSTLEVQGATTINGGLTVVGQTNSTSFQSASDYRIKNNVEPLDDNYTVDELIPVKYVNIILEKEDFGFIAHEVQNVFPNLVTGEKDGDDIQTLNYIGLIAILTKEIQELKRRVDVLEKNHQL